MRALSTLMLASCLASVPAAADFTVRCTQGCFSIPEEERTPNLLFIDDSQPEIVLTWATSSPQDPEAQVILRAGNPMVRDDLPEFGPIVFTESGGVWSASQDFEVVQLGRGTFISALITRRGSREEIVDWRGLRLLRGSELDEREVGRPFTGALSVEAVPELLQVSSGHGELPRHTGGDERVWWPIPESSGDVDVDIDGLHTGVPGITITRSPIWESRSEDWGRAVLEHLPDVVGHFVDFDPPWFPEVPDREIDLDGEIGSVLIKHYYGVITLFTNASTSVIRAGDLGLRGSKRYFAHETSANFRQRAHPRLWSSYSRREYSADPILLGLIADGLKRNGVVPGLTHVQQEDGDGGSVVYRVGFKARVRPWSVPGSAGSFRPGFVGIDVVAVRTGFGDVIARGDVTAEGLCKLIPCGEERRLDLSDPPRGYEVAAPLAITGQQSGMASILHGVPLRAAREGPPVEGIDFPETTRFAVAAQLRAGALVRKSGWFGTTIEDVIPINSYAQYVLKYTVAMVPRTVVVASDESILPDPSEFDTDSLVVPKKNVWERLREYLGRPALLAIGAGLLVVLLVLLAVFAPGVSQLMNAVFRLLAAILNRITRLLS